VRQYRIAAVLVGVLIGAFYWWVLGHFWGMHAVDTPFPKWLHTVLPAREHHALNTAAIYFNDLLLNVLLAVPFASMFVLFSRLNNWLCIAAAVLVETITTYWGTQWGGSPPIISYWGFWFGVGMSLFALPVAFVIIRAIPNRRQHD
jgi:hypothetical protein